MSPSGRYVRRGRDPNAVTCGVCEGLGQRFRVSCFVFRVSCFVFRVSSIGYWVLGIGFVVNGLGFSV